MAELEEGALGAWQETRKRRRGPLSRLRRRSEFRCPPRRAPLGVRAARFRGSLLNSDKARGPCILGPKTHLRHRERQQTIFNCFEKAQTVAFRPRGLGFCEGCWTGPPARYSASHQRVSINLLKNRAGIPEETVLSHLGSDELSLGA